MGKYINKIVNDFEENGSIEVKKLGISLVFDSIDELKQLDGEPFIKSAIELFKIIAEYDNYWIFQNDA